MKKIRTITTAMMLTTSLFGTTTYALAQIDEPDKVEVSEPEAPGFQRTSAEVQQEDEMTAEERSATAALKADKTAENSGKKSKREKKTSDSSSTNWLGIIALVVGAGGVALGVTNRKSLENLDKNNKELKANSSKAIAELTGRIANLEQNLANARQSIDIQNKEISNLHRAHVTQNANMNSSYAPQDPTAQDTPAQHYQQTAPTSAHQTQAAPQPIKLYCGAPKDGVFTNTSRTPSNKALYIITYTGEASSKFAFADTRDGAMLAARSISDFLEPGCILSGSKNPNFTRVKTITPGTVRRQANGSWVIENKAIVELV